MFSKSTRKVGWMNGLLLMGLILSCLTAPANASPPKRSRREPQKVSNAQLREGIHVLQATKQMLEKADHDYGGHRVAAVKAIGAAEHQLRLALQSQHKQANGSGKSNGKSVAKSGRTSGRGGKRPEPQKISNMQLADAIGVLERTRTLLAKADHDYGGHRAAAFRDLGAAIQQLKMALRFEKKAK